jgi:hypothetical protein
VRKNRLREPERDVVQSIDAAELLHLVRGHSEPSESRRCRAAIRDIALCAVIHHGGRRPVTGKGNQ